MILLGQTLKWMGIHVHTHKHTYTYIHKHTYTTHTMHMHLYTTTCTHHTQTHIPHTHKCIHITNMHTYHTCICTHNTCACVHTPHTQTQTEEISSVGKEWSRKKVMGGQWRVLSRTTTGISRAERTLSNKALAWGVWVKASPWLHHRKEFQTSWREQDWWIYLKYLDMAM